MTLAELARDAARTLTGADHAPADSQRDAALLARHLLGWDAAQWLTRAREPAPETFPAAYAALIARRAAHEPIAYIVGEREFYGRTFAVTPATLIPRPETELIVDEAVRWQRERQQRASATPDVNVADIGTGSGCLAITLALELPHAYVIATEMSSDALAVARANAARLSAADRIMFRHASLLGGATGFDLIVANLPYVGEVDRASLPAEVRDYEPASALFAGPDGLDVLRRFIPDALRALNPGGALMLEVGLGQAGPVSSLVVAASPTLSVHVRKDLQGIERVVLVNS